MLTRKDLDKLASELKAIKHEMSKTLEGRTGHVHACVIVANLCESSNPRFDRIRFYKACGYE